MRPRPPTACALLLALAGAGWAAPPQGEPELEVRAFSVPDTRAASALAERAEDHLAARRWPEALADLQELLELHPNELLAARRPVRGGRPSQQDVYPGVGEWVGDALRSLDPEVQELYRSQHEKRSREALEVARARADQRALIRVARLWPITPAAAEAWWTLGDLELESGHVRQALFAWSRALESDPELPALDPERLFLEPELLAQAEREHGQLPAGVRRRLQLAVSAAPDAELQAERAELRSELHLPGPGEGVRGTPGEEASTWQQPVKLPDHPFGLSSINLHPTRAGDSILVSTSLELLSVNAFTGAVRWRSGEPDGWDRLTEDRRQGFYRGIDHYATLIAPGASSTIAVAALQVPVTQVENTNFNQIPILRIIPDRRLSAFDLDTGKPLWNHAPPLDWDGESGDFSERMRIAAPPVVEASRIFVIAYRMQGRIDCHVACFELASGELVWSTQLISGQLPLNMFNRHQEEYAAPPVRIEGDRVVALTQLGTVATLDFFSGAIHWETVYDQVPLPPRRSPAANKRRPTWRNAAPVVADGVVVAAPLDSQDLVGIELESGTMLWSMTQAEANDIALGARTDIDLLLGADENHVFLGGRRLVALESRTGLSRERPGGTSWRFEDLVQLQESSPARPVLTADRIVVPTTSQRIEVDRFSGLHRRESSSWRGPLGGNLLLGEGMLFTLNSRYLNGYFAWDLLLARARAALERDPEDLGAAMDLAGLLAERGRMAWESGRTADAREWLDEAAELLEPYLGPVPARTEPEIAVRMHELLRTKARVLIDLIDNRGALEALRAAREYATTRAARRNSLLEESELLRAMGSEGPRAEVLEELEVSSGDLSVRCELELANGGDYGETDLRRALAYAGGPGAVWRLSPLVDRPARFELAVRAVPVGLWVSLECADQHASELAPQAELRELHRVMELWYEEPLPGGSAGRIATQRITGLLDTHGRDLYEPFERRAQELLESALDSREPNQLARVAELYPHSSAARRANDVRLGWALAAGDVERVARIVLGELPERWTPAISDEREARLALQLGSAIAAGGDAAYLEDLIRELSFTWPALVSPLEVHGNRTLSELARDLETAPPPAQPAVRSFPSASIARMSLPGSHVSLGAIPPALGGEPTASEVRLYAHEENLRRARGGREVSLLAFSSDEPEQPAWMERLPEDLAPRFWSGRVAFAPGLAVVATTRHVIAFERAGGEASEGGGRPALRRWTWPATDGQVVAVSTNAGLALAVIKLPGRPYRIHALELGGGREIWEADVEGSEYGHEPVCGSGKLVILPQRTHQQALVLDLFTGRRTLEIELPAVRREDAEASWIEDGRLIVPWFQQTRYPERNQILAVDLETGVQPWRISFQEMETGKYLLQSIVQFEAGTFLVLRRPSGYQAEGPEGLILDLGTRMGTRAPIFQLAQGQVPIGIPTRSRVRLDAPLLFLSSAGNGEQEMRLHAIQLPYGTERWVQRVPLDRDDLFSTTVPLPALGQNSVAVVFSEHAQKFGFRTNLYFFDRYTGARAGKQVLDKRLGKSSELSLDALGDALIVTGQDLLTVMR